MENNRNTATERRTTYDGMGLVTIIVGRAAVVEDIARRQVSNWTSGAALASGLPSTAANRDGAESLTASAGAAAGFAVFLVFYLLNGMGGGDVKLMAGFGSLVGRRRFFALPGSRPWLAD